MPFINKCFLFSLKFKIRQLIYSNGNLYVYFCVVYFNAFCLKNSLFFFLLNRKIDVGMNWVVQKCNLRNQSFAISANVLSRWQTVCWRWCWTIDWCTNMLCNWWRYSLWICVNKNGLCISLDLVFFFQQKNSLNSIFFLCVFVFHFVVCVCARAWSAHGEFVCRVFMCKRGPSSEQLKTVNLYVIRKGIQ